MRPHPRPVSLAPLALVLPLLLGACGGDDETAPPGDAIERRADTETGTDTGTGTGTGTDVVDALEAQTPDGRIDVPGPDGATTIAEFAAGTASTDPAHPAALAQLLALVGTDADGYLTDEFIVVHTSEADATLYCKAVERLDLPFRLIPVLPDGSGVDCG